MSLSGRCRRFPVRPLVVTAALVLAGIALAARDNSVDFRPYFGGLPPLVAASIVCLTGMLALFTLQQRFGFCVKKSRPVRHGWLVAAGLAVPFTVAVTVADLTLQFPSDINVRLPASLFFYPAMGLIAQLSLHVVPLALVLLAFSKVFRSFPGEHQIGVAITLASLPEAAFQIGHLHTSDGKLDALGVFVVLQLFVFGLTELTLFRRFDFVCMYVFRLTYYGYWHIVWGALRI